MNPTISEHRHSMPYPGLRPFEEADQRLFFGRETQTSDLLRQLEDASFVTVVGSSGSGKSSLVRAGLLPAVREGFLLGTTDWRIVVIKPGHQPYLRLLRVIQTELKPEALERELPMPAETSLARQASIATASANNFPPADVPATPEEKPALANLLRSDRGLLTLLDESGIGPETRVLLVVDQFEELFAFRRGTADRSNKNVASRDEAAAFVRMLMQSCADSDSRVRVVLTMRSDFIGDCEAFLGLPEAISRSQFLVPRLDRGQMAEAIEGPAKSCGLVSDQPTSAFTFEDGLVNRIINDAGDRPDQLPLMQHALMRTWKFAVARSNGNPVCLTQADYDGKEGAGGIEKALSRHADSAWNEIKDNARQALIAQRLFLLLCDISLDGQITRRRPLVSEVMEVTGATLKEIESIVRLFQGDDRNFLLPPAAQPLSAETLLDISHEALLRRWDLFATQWQDQERRDAAELRQLVDRASQHNQGQGDLIPVRDLGRIGDWKKRVSPQWSQRYVDSANDWDKAMAFLAASQSHARLMKFWRVGIGVLLVLSSMISICLMIVALKAESKAKKAADASMKAADAFVKSFTRTIGMTDGPSSSPVEQAALWDLAELDSDFTAVREQVIDQWFLTEDTFSNAARRNGLGLRASGELNADLRRRMEIHVKELADRLATALEQETDTYRRPILHTTLAELAVRLEPADAARLAEQLAAAMENATDGYRLDRLSYALAALAARLEPADAARLAARGANRLNSEMKKETDAGRLDSLSKALAVLAARLEPADATRLVGEAADRLATVMGQETDAYRLGRLSYALAALTAQLKPEDAARLAARGAERLATSIEQATGTAQLDDLSNSLAALAAQLAPEDAARLAARAVDYLATAMEETTDTDRLYRLSNALTTLAARLAPADAVRLAARAADCLATALDKESDASQQSNQSYQLATLAAWLAPPDAARLADRLATNIDKETDADRLNRLSHVLMSLAARLAPVDAARLAERLATVMEQESDAGRRSSLSYAWGALAGQLAPADAVRLCDRVVTAMEKTNDSDQLAHFSVTLTSLAVRLEPADAARVATQAADRLATAIEQETDAGRFGRLTYALRSLDAHLEPVGAALLADRMVTAIVKETEAGRQYELRDVLAALAVRLAPVDAARLGDRLAKVIDQETDTNRREKLSFVRRALAGLADPTQPTTRGAENLAALLEQQISDAASALDRETDAYQIRDRSYRMAELATQLKPAAQKTLLFALSHQLRSPIYAGPNAGEMELRMRAGVVASLPSLGKQELAAILKWPFCVGEAEKLVLAELESKLSDEFKRPIKFDGDLGEFIEQAESLGIKDLAAPAKRPLVEDALKELAALRQAAEVK